MLGLRDVKEFGFGFNTRMSITRGRDEQAGAIETNEGRGGGAQAAAQKHGHEENRVRIQKGDTKRLGE